MMLLDYSTPSLPIFMTIAPDEISDMLCPTLLRQSVYSRLAGYEDVNDAGRLSVDPVMRAITGKNDNGKQAASANTMGRFETEIMTQRESQQSVRYQWQVGKPSYE
jgi:hypothetical protein